MHQWPEHDPEPGCPRRNEEIAGKRRQFGYGRSGILPERQGMIINRIEAGS